MYVDTHIVTRMASGKFNDLSEKAMELLNHGRLFYSPMVGLELHYLYERNRLSCTPADMLSHLLKEANLQVSDVSFAQIALKAREVHSLFSSKSEDLDSIHSLLSKSEDLDSMDTRLI